MDLTNFDANISEPILKRTYVDTKTSNVVYLEILNGNFFDYCPHYFDSINPDLSIFVKIVTGVLPVPNIHIRSEWSLDQKGENVLYHHIDKTKTSKEDIQTFEKLMVVQRIGCYQNNGSLKKLKETFENTFAADLLEIYKSLSEEQALALFMEPDFFPINFIKTQNSTLKL